MALTLSAEQKTISEVFSENNQYVIPPFQRPYSWEEDQCDTLWEDLTTSFERKDEGYFLGNIIIAKSTENKNISEVIDGQQRLITISLFIKAFSMHLTNIKKLTEKLYIDDEWTDENIQRLTTQIYETSDQKDLNKILNCNELFIENNTITKNEKSNKFKTNLYFFYNKLNEYKNRREFAKYFLEKVSLLPILSEDTNKSSAREKALKIFETINNRGLDLSDTDIFKARLYTLALNKQKEDIFINEWNLLTKKADELKNTLTSSKGPLLDIFRIYSHIIRGRQKNNKSEIGLREFFTQLNQSSFEVESYVEVIKDLNKIIDVVTFYQDTIELKSEHNELSKWFQILSEYTNQYPLWVLYVYIYKFYNINKISNNDIVELISVSKNLIKIAFHAGSTTKIKYKMYNIIISISQNDNTVKFLLDDLDNLNNIKNQNFGRLKNSFLLLSFYLNKQEKALEYYKFDKLINSIDITNLNSSWKKIDYYEYNDTLGNMLLIDMPKKRILLNNKLNKVYSKCTTTESKELISKLKNWSYDDYTQRNKILVDRLIQFFQNDD